MSRTKLALVAATTAAVVAGANLAPSAHAMPEQDGKRVVLDAPALGSCAINFLVPNGRGGAHVDLIVRGGKPNFAPLEGGPVGPFGGKSHLISLISRDGGSFLGTNVQVGASPYGGGDAKAYGFEVIPAFGPAPIKGGPEKVGVTFDGVPCGTLSIDPGIGVLPELPPGN